MNESRWNDDYAANSLLRKRFRKETKNLKNSNNFSHGMKLNDLSAKDLQRLKLSKFNKADRRRQSSKNRDMILSNSIFGGSKANKELMRLKQKLGHLPKSTLGVLRQG